MNIGFFINWNKHSLASKGNVLGDELLANSLTRAMLKDRRVQSARLFAPNDLPAKKLDYMIYLNDTKPVDKWARNHICYLQNGYGESAAEIVKRFVGYDFLGYVFFSKRLEDIFKENCSKTSLYCPFGVDLDFFYPREFSEEYNYDVSYVGNDIKGTKRSNLYLYPAVKFNFGLYGNWKIPKARFRIWKNFFRRVEPYQKSFEILSRGRIPQEAVPTLYSSSKVNLNCTLQACVDWDVITLRTFEVLACKGFLITDMVPSAKKLLKDKVVFTTGGDDLKDKIEYFLTHENERKVIAEAGYEFVREKASISFRAKEIIDYLESLN